MEYLIEEHQLSIRQACVALQVSRSLFYYSAKGSSDKEIVSILTEFAERHPTYGFWKMYKMMKSKGAKWNHKKVYRIYTGAKSITDFSIKFLVLAKNLIFAPLKLFFK